MKKTTFLATGLAVALAVAAVHASEARPSQAPPGWNAAALADAIEWAADHHSTGLVILWRGEIVVDEHWPDASGGRGFLARRAYRGLRQGETPEGHAIEDVASVQKSVLSVLLAMAEERGLLDPDATVATYLGRGWSAADATAEDRILVRHLWTMTSGLDDELRAVHPPGTHWAYVNDAYHRLHAVLEAATGREGNEILQEWLGEPLGWSEHTRHQPRRRSGLRGLVSTAHDLARFGEMARNGGTYAGQRIVSAESLRRTIAQSQDLNPAYGFLWWRNDADRSVLPRGRETAGALFPSAPSDLIMALGALDRHVAISRKHELVVVRIGGPVKGRGEPGAMDGFWAHLSRALPPVGD